MKWKIPEEPEVGEERTEIRFAWLPTMTDDGHICWLEKVRVTERYKKPAECHVMGNGLAQNEWVEIKVESLR